MIVGSCSSWLLTIGNHQLPDRPSCPTVMGQLVQLPLLPHPTIIHVVVEAMHTYPFDCNRLLPMYDFMFWKCYSYLFVYAEKDTRR